MHQRKSRDKVELYSGNNDINKSEALRVDDRPDYKYLMCLFQHSVSVKATVRVTVTISAALAFQSTGTEEEY